MWTSIQWGVAPAPLNGFYRGVSAAFWLATAAASTACSSSSNEADSATGVEALLPALYEAGSTTFCAVDGGRGFDPTADITSGQRLILVEAWYPVDSAAAADPELRQARFGDYFADDPELLLRSERALLETTGFAADVIERHMLLAPEQFEVERSSLRDAPLARGAEPFPVILYSHGTLQQRFTNDSAAENLARRGYVVLAPEHTGNDAMAPFGAYCPTQMSQAGVMPPELSDNPRFDSARAEYRGQTFDPFFLVGDPPVPAASTINPIEVSLTLDRLGDYRAALAEARGVLDGLAEGGAASVDFDNVGLIGYSRGAMHGLVAAEMLPEVKVSVALVGGTPLRFYERDVEAQPINDMLAAMTQGARTRLTSLTKPVIDIIGGEDSRRKATTDAAAAIGVYDAPSADAPSPIVSDSYESNSAFAALVRIDEIDHFDLVDDPFVVAYRAQGGISRPGAFDASQMYTLRPLADRQAIRDYYLQAAFDVFLKGRPRDALFSAEPFDAQGVSVSLKPE